MESRSFHLGDILSITTERLLSPRLMEGIYDILDFMAQDKLWTHQLPRASRECKPWLLRWYPQLKEIDVSGVCKDNWEAFLDEMISQYGEELTVWTIPQDDHEHKHPWDELVEMRGTDEGIVVIEKED